MTKAGGIFSLVCVIHLSFAASSSESLTSVIFALRRLAFSFEDVLLSSEDPGKGIVLYLDVSSPSKSPPLSSTNALSPSSKAVSFIKLPSLTAPLSDSETVLEIKRAARPLPFSTLLERQYYPPMESFTSSPQERSEREQGSFLEAARDFPARGVSSQRLKPSATEFLPNLSDVPFSSQFIAILKVREAASSPHQELSNGTPYSFGPSSKHTAVTTHHRPAVATLTPAFQVLLMLQKRAPESTGNFPQHVAYNGNQALKKETQAGSPKKLPEKRIPFNAFSHRHKGRFLYADQEGLAGKILSVKSLFPLLNHFSVFLEAPLVLGELSLRALPLTPMQEGVLMLPRQAQDNFALVEGASPVESQTPAMLRKKLLITPIPSPALPIALFPKAGEEEEDNWSARPALKKAERAVIKDPLYFLLFSLRHRCDRLLLLSLEQQGTSADIVAFKRDLRPIDSPAFDASMPVISARTHLHALTVPLLKGEPSKPEGNVLFSSGKALLRGKEKNPLIALTKRPFEPRDKESIKRALLEFVFQKESYHKKISFPRKTERTAFGFSLFPLIPAPRTKASPFMPSSQRKERPLALQSNSPKEEDIRQFILLKLNEKVELNLERAALEEKARHEKLHLQAQEERRFEIKLRIDTKNAINLERAALEQEIKNEGAAKFYEWKKKERIATKEKKIVSLKERTKRLDREIEEFTSLPFSDLNEKKKAIAEIAQNIIVLENKLKGIETEINVCLNRREMNKRQVREIEMAQPLQGGIRNKTRLHLLNPLDEALLGK